MTAKKTAAPKNTAPTGSFDPVVIDTSTAPEIVQVKLFEIDGVDYTIAQHVRPNIAMAYLRDVNTGGQEYALAKAMETLLGEDAMNALADCEAVGDEEMSQIMKIVSDMLFATMSKLAGKSGAGQVN